MKIAFDQQVFLLQEYGGISRYFCCLAREFAQSDDLSARIVAPFHFNRNLSSLKGITDTGILLPNRPTKLRRLAMEFSKFSARCSIKKFSPDIVHETYFSFDDFHPKGSKRILTVYDFIHERYADLFDQGHKTAEPKKAAALRADHVICISESTRRDLIEFCGVEEEKISVIYLGADDGFQIKNKLETSPLRQSRPYLLFVGSRGGYKNYAGFLKAFSQSSRLKSDFDIVCFGGGALTSEEMQTAADYGLRPDQVIHHGGADEILAQLYFHAAAFVYPSFYEGFGIPPLEAMAAGCPVISSNSSSLPEVIGNAGEYFDPLQTDEMIAAMEKVLYSDDRRNDLISRGFEQENKFSWAKCANETQDLYRSLL